ncbi:MAG TPA: hypothetical protein VHN74_04165 [Candidatus Angelobacter sp.]|jgi:hypothetical protein|nr:hypothetical protein [Candidatus Angelobacter sp.]
MPVPFTVSDCTVDNNSITIIFSDPVDTDQKSKGRYNNPAHYSVFDPGSVDFTEPKNLNNAATTVQTIQQGPENNIVVITLAPSSGNKEFQSGDWVTIVVKGVKAEDGTLLEDGIATIARQVPGKGKTARLTRDVEDAISYPILTEEVGYRPSPVGLPSGGSSGMPGSGGGGLGVVAAKAVSDVLGWKTNSADPKGFVGALTQAFTLSDVEGHVEATWTPRTYAVQTDLGGGITGAQASLYMRAKNALDSALPLLDGLYPLDPEADPEYVKALREMARSQMTEIVKELGTVGLPSILRIDTYFGILLGQNPAKLHHGRVQFDPDKVAGTLGELRDTYGIYFTNNPFNNSVGDEQDITNFRVISDYLTSLMQSWIANRNFFRLGTKAPAFFGTQLVLISRQFTVISETVNEVRFALDSVFIGPNERQALLLEFTDPALAPMFLEDVLNEVESFASDEGPRLLRDGGKISVTNNILPVVQSLQNLVEEAHEPLNIDVLPDGLRTARVRNSLDDLNDQLEALVVLIQQVEQQVPPAEDKFAITEIKDLDGTFAIFGNDFDPAATVSFISGSVVTAGDRTSFYSSQRIDSHFSPTKPGKYDVTVTNPNGESATLANAIAWDGKHVKVRHRVTVTV